MLSYLRWHSRFHERHCNKCCKSGFCWYTTLVRKRRLISAGHYLPFHHSRNTFSTLKSFKWSNTDDKMVCITFRVYLYLAKVPAQIITTGLHFTRSVNECLVTKDLYWDKQKNQPNGLSENYVSKRTLPLWLLNVHLLSSISEIRGFNNEAV